MSRVHYWQFLLNSEGQPIPDANISIYFAGTEESANIYFDEYGSNHSSDAPQIITNNMGYFEFWIGDASEEYGYTKDQKFKLRWSKDGVASGEVDWIDIFTHVIEVDETDVTSNVRNKVISNKLAYRWEEHKNSTLQDDGFPIHGIEAVNEYDNDDDPFPNKLISNKLGKRWNDHWNDTFSTIPASASAHGIEELDRTDEDETFNKLISNKVVFDIDTDIITIYDNLDLINDKIIEMGNAGNIFLPFALSDTWVITHNFGVKYVSVTCYGQDDLEVRPQNIELLDYNNTIVTFDEPIAGYAVVTGNVVEDGGPEAPPFVIEGDHGSLTGLSSDDHLIYVPVDGSRGFTEPVHGITPTLNSHLATKEYVDTMVNFDHQYIANCGIGDDHIQYLHIDGRRGFQNPVTGKLPVDYNHLATKEYVDGTAGDFNSWIIMNSDFNAITKSKYIIDTSGGTVTCTLPHTSTNGHFIRFADGWNFATNELIILRNGNTIEGLAEDMTVDTENRSFELIYYNNNWIIA